MGAVYLGEHVSLGSKVAIKYLRPELASDADLVQRFFNEARAATRIEHAAVVQTMDFGTHPTGGTYFVMEFLPGESLATRLRRGPIEPAPATAIIRELARALAV